MLRENTTLRSLDLRSGTIGDSGALALVDAIAMHPNLEKVNLRSNAITESGAKKFVFILIIFETVIPFHSFFSPSFHKQTSRSSFFQASPEGCEDRCCRQYCCC